MSADSVWYLYNAHGDVVNLADEDGDSTKAYTYDAFGVEKNPSSTDTNPYRYCGEYFDKETSTYYLRARYYNPSTGRFLSEDSVRGLNNDPLSLNLYTYCGNNPVLYGDPSGNLWQLIPIIVGLALIVTSCSSSTSKKAPSPSSKPTSKPTATKQPTSTPSPTPSPFKYKWTGTHVTQEFLNKVVNIASKLGVKPDDLMAVMSFESWLNPSAVNKASGATGLIQFMPSTAKNLGTTVEALAKMTAVQQLDYVYKYLEPYKGRMKTLGDIYMAILWPAGVGKNDDYVLWSQGSITYTQNQGLDVNKDGKVTVKEAVQKVVSRRDSYGLS